MVLLLSRNRTMALLFTGVDRDISEGCKHMSDGAVVQPALMSFFLIAILSRNDFTKTDATLSSTGENNDGLHQVWVNMKGLA